MSHCTKKVTRRLATHLRNAGRAHRGPRRSLRLIVHGWNADFPPDKPVCFVWLFGEEGYFFCDETCTGAPPDGYHLVGLTGAEKSSGRQIANHRANNKGQQSLTEPGPAKYFERQTADHRANKRDTTPPRIHRKRGQQST